MKSFDKLGYRGRIRRLHKQAQAALKAYGLSKAKIKFIGYSGNTHYQIDSSKCAQRELGVGRFWENHFILRLHQPNYQTGEAIQSELLWLQALLQDTELVVPEPIYNTKGELVTITDVPGLPSPQYATLLRWVKGQKISKGIGPHHYEALGRLISQLHNHSATWQPPKGFTRIQYDWEGLFSDDGLFEVPANEIWASIPKPYQNPITEITNQVREVMQKLGKSSRVYGLIHADLNVDSNTLWHQGEIRPVDFDDSAYGYWIYDLAIPLAEIQDDETRYRFKNALLKGYTEYRVMPPSQWKHLDLFIGAWHATAMLYAINYWIVNPMFREVTERWRNQEGEYLIQTLARL
jgi:Ser/Thr protein kinase RdoA (MazF antagonist)